MDLPQDAASWIVPEFANAQLGDTRRSKRLLRLATALAAQPSAGLPPACPAPAHLAAAYHFLATDDITHAALLAPHIQTTQFPAAPHPLILAVQDSCLLDYSHHPATTGLGPLSTPNHQGLVAHSTLAFTPDRVPLGRRAQEVWARDPALTDKRERHKDLPIGDKESNKWLVSWAAVNAARVACPAPAFVSVGDREADIYDLFVAPRQPGVDLLVRAAYDRCTTGEEGRLGASVAAAAAQTTLHVQIPRAGTRAARLAQVWVRWGPGQLKPPRRRAGEQLPCVSVWAIGAYEEAPPSAAERVEWPVVDHLPAGECPGSRGAPGGVWRPVGDRGLAQGLEKWLSDRSAAVGERGRAATRAGDLSCHRLADYVCGATGVGAARSALYGLAGGGRMAGAVLYDP